MVKVYTQPSTGPPTEIQAHQPLPLPHADNPQEVRTDLANIQGNKDISCSLALFPEDDSLPDLTKIGEVTTASALTAGERSGIMVRDNFPKKKRKTDDCRLLLRRQRNNSITSPSRYDNEEEEENEEEDFHTKTLQSSSSTIKRFSRSHSIASNSRNGDNPDLSSVASPLVRSARHSLLRKMIETADTEEADDDDKDLTTTHAVEEEKKEDDEDA
eukprot:jgi/Psemu1/34960/gm1.34960_g